MSQRLKLSLHLLLAAACLLPLVNPRAAAGMLVPSERSSAPNRPVEEEDEGERADSEYRDAQIRTERRSDPRNRAVGRLGISSPVPPAHLRFVISCAHAGDPFRNGLGTPYRC
jgi:hypothetical protein